jgi:outer membrane protein TolC
MRQVIIFVLSIHLAFQSSAQTDVDKVLSQVEINNKSIQSNKKYWEAKRAEYKIGLTPYDPQAEFDYLFGSPAAAGNQKDFSLTQRLDFPTVYKRKRNLSTVQIAQTELNQAVFRQDVLLEAKLIALQIIYLNKKIAELNKRQATTLQLVTDYQKKLDKGDVIILDVNKAKLQLLNIQHEAVLTQNERQVAHTKLSALNGGTHFEIKDTLYPAIPFIPDFETLDSMIEANDPIIKVYEQEIKIQQQNVSLQKALNLPKIEAGYHSQGILGQSYKGIHAGISIPLWENKNKLKAAQANVDYATSNVETHILEHKLENKGYYDQLDIRAKAMEEYKTLLMSLNNTALLSKALRLGQITVIQYFQDESYYYAAYDKFLQMELEYNQAVARLFKFML